MPFKEGDDPKRNLGGRPKGSRNKNRSVKSWDDVTDKYSLMAVEKAVELMRRGSEAAKRDMAIEVLSIHKKVLAGKVSCPDDFKAAILRHSAEALDTLVGMARSKSVAESTKKVVLKFFMSNSMESLAKEDTKAEGKQVDTTVPVISLVTLGGKKPEVAIEKEIKKEVVTKKKSFTLTKV